MGYAELLTIDIIIVNDFIVQLYISGKYIYKSLDNNE